MWNNLYQVIDNNLFLFVVGVISGALLYIRDDFKQVEKSTVLQVLVMEEIFNLIFML